MVLLDLVILPGLVDYRFPSGLCHLLPDRAGQEHQLDAPGRGHQQSVQLARRSQVGQRAAGPRQVGQAERGPLPHRVRPVNDDDGISRFFD